MEIVLSLDVRGMAYSNTQQNKIMKYIRVFRFARRLLRQTEALISFNVLISHRMFYASFAHILLLIIKFCLW